MRVRPARADEAGALSALALRSKAFWGYSPQFMALLGEARALARREGFRALAIHADPNAEAFYLRHGATRVGEVPSGSIHGRELPLLRLEIE